MSRTSAFLSGLIIILSGVLFAMDKPEGAVALLAAGGLTAAGGAGMRAAKRKKDSDGTSL